MREMTQDPVSLDDFRQFGNIPEAYRVLLAEVGRVTYRGTPFGQIPRLMASPSAYETEPEKQRQEGEHALLGLGLAMDLPAEIVAFDDKPDLDVRYPDGSLGGVEVVRIVYETIYRSDAESAKIQKGLREAIASSRARSSAMMGRYLMVVQSAEPRRASRQRIVDGVLGWIDDGLLGVTEGDVHVTLPARQRALSENGVSLRLGSVPGTGWEINVGSLAQPVPVLDIVDFVDTWIEKKRKKSGEYRYTSGLRLVMPMVGFHPDPVVVDDLMRLRDAHLNIEPFVRVVVYRDLDYVVLGNAE
jgi:hypothetical protein